MSIKPARFKELLTRYLDGKASPEEQKLLDGFFSSYEKEVLENPSSFHDHRTRDEILENILERIPLKGRAQRQLFPKYAWQIAASLLILCGVAYFIMSRTTLVSPSAGTVALVEQAAARGQKVAVELPDGSKVILNAGSALKYPSAFSETRMVTLEGEAYFEVAHNRAKPFIVRTAQTSTEVLGTTFNIREQKGVSTQVTLVSGVVQVEATDGEPAVLSPNQQAVVNDRSQTIQVRTVDTESVIGWKDNVIYFDKTPLKEAVATLEQWYDARIEIVNPRLNACLITAKYREESLENVLNSIGFLLHAQVEYVDERTIRINGNGCK